MVTTVAKEGPAPFSDAFVEIDSSTMRDLVRSWEEEGYTQFLNAKFPRIAVGTLMAEARILSVGLFFKGYNSSFENLKAGTFTGATKVLVLWKHYANMSSVGKSVSHAELEPAQVGAWLTFLSVREAWSSQSMNSSIVDVLCMEGAGDALRVLVVFYLRPLV